MTSNQGLCFVIADGEHARFVAADQSNALRTTRQFDSATAHLASHDLGTDRPGRSFESARPGSHGVAPRHDPHDWEKAKFADFVADQIGIAAGEGMFDRLVLVAPAHCLNEIEDELDTRTARMVVGRVTKDLVKTPDHALSEHLSTWVGTRERVA